MAQDEDQVQQTESAQPQQQQETKAKTGVQVDGLEFDFKFSPSSLQILRMLDCLTKKDGTPQEVLAQAVCSCHPQSVSASSLGLNTT